VTRAPIPSLARLPELNSRGGIAAAEAYAWHRELLERRASDYDRRVAMRILKGRELSAADYQQLLRERTEITQQVASFTAAFDAVALPTVPIVAPCMSQFENDEQYVALNAQALRNAAIANFLDRCAISMPVHHAGEAPVGLMLMGEHGADRRLFSTALGIESLLSPANL
jgi:aspartyl-tRNA(Asn)/glutamyl-tRNA(Gln) amidotransferase subunit A